MGIIASPADVHLIIDRDQDLTIKITLPAGTYLSGGAGAWALSWTMFHPTTGAAIITKTTSSGVVVTTAGSTTVDALFTVTLADTDIDAASGVRVKVIYPWTFKRIDAGSEVNIAGGTCEFKR